MHFQLTNFFEYNSHMLKITECSVYWELSRTIIAYNWFTVKFLSRLRLVNHRKKALQKANVRVPSKLGVYSLGIWLSHNAYAHLAVYTADIRSLQLKPQLRSEEDMHPYISKGYLCESERNDFSWNLSLVRRSHFRCR